MMLMVRLCPAQQHIRIENAHLGAITVNALPADRLIRERRCVGKTDDRLAPASRAFRRRHQRRSARRKLSSKEALNIYRQPLRLCLGEQTRFDRGGSSIVNFIGLSLTNGLDPSNSSWIMALVFCVPDPPRRATITYRRPNNSVVAYMLVDLMVAVLTKEGVLYAELPVQLHR
jgi:hypothetical protein